MHHVKSGEFENSQLPESLMLNGLLPRDELSIRLGAALILDEFGYLQINDIAILKPECLFGIGASVWNRIVQKRWLDVNPMRFAKYFQKEDPDLHNAIFELLGVQVIQDIYFAKGWRESKKASNLVVELLVARVYPNDLHLADITFMDPTRPIAEKDRRFAHQTHRGFGLLSIVMDNLQLRATELDCEQITLTAASLDQIPLFGNYGYVVEDSMAGKVAMENGMGIPMERDV